MFRSLILGVVVLAGLTLVGASASTAEARGCYRGSYGGGYHHYPTYRTSHYYGGHHHGGYNHYAPVYRQSYYGGHYGGHHGHRSGISLSFGF